LVFKVPNVPDDEELSFFQLVSGVDKTLDETAQKALGLKLKPLLEKLYKSLETTKYSIKDCKKVSSAQKRLDSHVSAEKKDTANAVAELYEIVSLIHS
jgi:hypothetical protein